MNPTSVVDKLAIPSFAVGGISLLAAIPNTISEVYTLFHVISTSFKVGDNLRELYGEMRRLQESFASWVIASGINSQAQIDLEIEMRAGVIFHTLANISRQAAEFDRIAQDYGLAFENSEKANDAVDQLDRWNMSAVHFELQRQERISKSFAEADPALNGRRYVFTVKHKSELNRHLVTIRELIEHLHSLLPANRRLTQKGLLKDHDMGRMYEIHQMSVKELCTFIDSAQDRGDRELVATASQLLNTRQASVNENRMKRTTVETGRGSRWQYGLKLFNRRSLSRQEIKSTQEVAEIMNDDCNVLSRALIERRKWINEGSSEGERNSKRLLAQLAMDSLCENLSANTQRPIDDLIELPPVSHAIDENNPRNPIFILAFELPSTVAQIDTLATLIELGRTSRPGYLPSTEERLTLSLSVAKSLLKIYENGWSHTEICLENIIFFREAANDFPAIEQPSLCGFHHSQPETLTEISRGYEIDGAIIRELYRHPLCAGAQTRVGSYDMRYDIYSLGVVLTKTNEH